MKLKSHVCLAKFIVTLKLLEIYRDKIEIEDLGSQTWISAANYLMARKYAQ